MILDHCPVITELATPQELEALQVAAAQDEHLAVAPTHVIRKSGEIVGYVGFNSLPHYQGWLHRTKMKARDTAMVVNVIENQARWLGWKSVVQLVPETSPMLGHLLNMGYKELQRGVSVLIKKLI